MPKQNKELKWLKELRNKKDMSTYEVAEKIGISQSLYSSIENGLRGVTVENAKRIARFYGFEWTKFYK